MRISLFLVILVIPFAVLAGDFTATGVGGGGWLHSGAILPTDSDVIVIGGDVAGPYRTDDMGVSWYPWTDGLANSDRLPTFHVEDLLGVDYGDWTGFFCAGLGGIYYADENGDWDTTTPVPSYSYKLAQNATYAYPIPFSCLDWRGDSLVVAGAGQLWWSSDYDFSLDFEQSAYPGLESFYAYGDFDEQWTVWTLDLDDGANAAWEPDEDSEFGAARDISFTIRNDITYIAVATSEGIFLKGPGGWISVCDSLYDEDLTCWGLHLTDRGTLYAAMGWADTSCNLPTGVYRMFDIGDSAWWDYPDDGVDILPDSLTMEEIGNRWWTELIELGVVDGDSVDPDVLYLGCRTSQKSLFRGFQPYHADSLCHWRHKMYNDSEFNYYYRDSVDVEQDLDPGWADWSDLGIIFPPVVSQYHPEMVVVAPSTRVYISDDTGDSWTQSYTDDGGGGFWISRGYNETCVADLAFMPDRRLIESTLDHGLYRSYDADLEEFEYLYPPTGTATSGNNVPYNRETGDLEFRTDWPDSGEDAIIFISGDFRATPNKLMWIDEDDEWHNLTCGLASGDRYRFYDFVFADDDTCFISYAKYDDEVGSAGADLVEFGVLRGRYHVGLDEWLWSPWNEGLTAVTTPTTFNTCGMNLIFHEPTNRIFMVAGGTNAMLPGQSEVTWVPGGVYMLPSAADTTWQLVFGGSGSSYQDFRCLTQDSDGDVLYAGTRGILWTSIGTVFKCEAPATAESTWVAMANTDSTGYPFGFEKPLGTEGSATYTDTTANQRLTFVTCLAVDPWDDDIVYAGFGCTGFMEQDGLWKYSPGGGWEKMSAGETFDGQNVNCLAIKRKLKKAKLVVGTHGQELYYTTLEDDSGQIGEDTYKAERKISSGLKLLDIRTAMGGRAEVNFTLEHPSPVAMKVYDVTGRLVKYQQADFDAGHGSLVWDGCTRSGHQCASGIYFLRLTARDIKADGKFMLVR
jgi:hypothetical protein